MDREKELKELLDTAENLLEGINNLIEVVKGNEMEIEVVNAGNCMMCGKPIKLSVPPTGYSKLPNIFFCRECESKLEYDQKKAESADNHRKEHKTMTKAEFEKMDFRNLTDKARKVAESSDQSLYEYVKDLDANDFAGISAVLEDIADLSEEE